jgi:hypothetical protein
MAEIWKGKYKGEEVALKVLRVSRDNPDVMKAKSVSVSHVTVERFVPDLTSIVEILQRSRVDEAGRARQYSPILWGIGGHP